jgi:predicted PurR-regulated permease PerM
MLRWLLYLVFVVIGYFILRRLSSVLSPLLMAAGIAYLFDPVADALEARGIRRSMAVALLLLLFLSAMVGLGLILFPLLWTEIDRFATALPEMLEESRLWLENRLGLRLPAEWTGVLASKELGDMLSKALGPVASAAASALGGIFSLLGYLTELLLVPVFAFYFLVDWHRMLARVESLVPPRHRDEVGALARQIDSVVSSWLRGQFTVVAILALLYAGCFYAIGIQLAVSIGLLVGLLTIVPFLGTLYSVPHHEVDTSSCWKPHAIRVWDRAA